MLTSEQVRTVIRTHAPRGEWMKMAAIYPLVSDNVELDDKDRQLITGRGRSTRWQRVVRNYLQGAKRSGEVIWERGRGFQFPT